MHRPGSGVDDMVPVVTDTTARPTADRPSVDGSTVAWPDATVTIAGTIAGYAAAASAGAGSAAAHGRCRRGANLQPGMTRADPTTQPTVSRSSRNGAPEA